MSLSEQSLGIVGTQEVEHIGADEPIELTVGGPKLR